jgi:4-hydroxy-4-methyl-2-oxoglutarate aldolase
MLHVAVEQCQAGDVLVVAPTSTCGTAYFGELLACSLAARGVLGLVIKAGVRDVSTWTKVAFPVWSKAVSAQATVKEALATVNVPIVCAGRIGHPGDLIIADDDGVVVVPRRRLRRCCARTRPDNEAQTRARLRAGELGLDNYGMREKLAKECLVYRPTEAKG